MSGAAGRLQFLRDFLAPDSGRDWRNADPQPPASGAAFPAALARAMRERGLWKLWVPEQFGGEALALPAAVELFEEAGSIDGSIGFALAIGAGGGLFGAFLPEAAAHEIFSPPEALIAGSGEPSGRAEAVAGGFRVHGRWRFASLIRQATWITANTVRDDTGGVMAVAVPARSVMVVEDWDVHALAATDSQTMVMEGVEVDDGHTFDLAAPPRIDAPVYRFPFEALAAASFAAVTVGVARGGVEAFAARMAANEDGDGAGSGARAWPARLARADGLQQAGFAHLDSMVHQAWDEQTRRGRVAAATQARVHLAAVTAAGLALDAVNELAAVAGMPLLSHHDRFSRCWRDVHGLAQHALISQRRLDELGAARLRPRRRPATSFP